MPFSVEPIEEIAYIAGIFDGEGHVGSSGVRSIQVGITSTDLDILERVVAVFGGTIYGPYEKEERKPIFAWKAGSRKPSWAFLDAVYPFLSSRRQGRIDELEARRTDYYADQRLGLTEAVFRFIDVEGMTQAETAAMLGHSQSYISRIYRGERGLVDA